jgi:hypothetical protein
MAGQTVLGNVISLFERIGIYNVVLPFLLAFTITFAIFEKSKVLGTEKDGSPKKNLNAMAAFVVAFLVIASSRLVDAITKMSANVVVLILLGVFFLLLVGTFYGAGEEVKISGGWKAAFTVIMFLGIIMVFLDAMETNKTSWLEMLGNYLGQFWTSTAVASIILIIGIIIFVIIMVREPKPGSGGSQ